MKENWLLLLAIVYILSPIDAIPDWLPVVGQADDLLVLLFEIVDRVRKFKNKRVIEGQIDDFEESETEISNS